MPRSARLGLKGSSRARTCQAAIRTLRATAALAWPDPWRALTSLYSLFPTTRDILRRYGPGVAQAKRHGQTSFGLLAVTILNNALRPLLSVWHPRLQDYEDQRPATATRVEWEASWSEINALRRAIDEVRTTINQYADLLADVAEVPNLHR